jgi:hypothetical protein
MGFYEGGCRAADHINERRDFEEANKWSRTGIYLCANAPVQVERGDGE